MANRFHQLLEELAEGVERDYRQAREHARSRNPQRAGHEGESTWKRLLDQWGPGWPVVTRKYIVGPLGESNEVDVVLLRPDYPARLRDEPSVLISGVAAAFSVKLTLRKEHIAEALDQKKRVLGVDEHPDWTVETIVTGRFPFGVLAHSTDLFPMSADFGKDIQRLYGEIGHGPGKRVSHPREELDAVLIADKGFFSTIWSSISVTTTEDDEVQGTPTPFSVFMHNPTPPGLAGGPLAQFLTWLNRRCRTSSRESTLHALRAMLGSDWGRGSITSWSRDVYPDGLLRYHSDHLLSDRGHPLMFG